MCLLRCQTKRKVCAMTTEIVIFDCDGVLFDTRKSARHYYNVLFAEVGAPILTEAQFNSAFMSTVEEAIDQFIVDPHQKTAAHTLQKKFDSTRFLDEIEVAPTTLPFVRFLRQFAKTAIVTNRSYSMHEIVDRWQLKNHFDIIVTALDATHPKPNPEGLQKVLHTFHVLPENALFIGDSPSDQQASAHAHIPFVSFREPDMNAAFHITEIPELATILQLPI